MPHIIYILLAATALCGFSTLFALPMEVFATNHQCRCIVTTSSFINPRSFKKIEILPAGAHCRKTEVVITRMDNKKICVSPEAKWINSMISSLSRKNNVKSILPTETPRTMSA